MRRREFITLLLGIISTRPLVARAEQSTPVRRIGIVMPFIRGEAEQSERVLAFRKELARLGWTDGGNVRFDERWTTDNMEIVRAEAANLISVKAGRYLCHRWPGHSGIDAIVSLSPNRSSGSGRSGGRWMGGKLGAPRRKRHRLRDA